jgi:hypothetical protein
MKLQVHQKNPLWLGCEHTQCPEAFDRGDDPLQRTVTLIIAKVW